MKKFYIICGICCACFLCLGLYFLVTPLFVGTNAENNTIENGETTDNENDEDLTETIYYLGVNYTEITLTLDETQAKITYTILPTTALPNVTVEDENILEIENFIIKPKKVGSTKVILTHEKYVKEILVTIYEKEISITFDSNSFNSGKDLNGTYTVYNATVTSNFEFNSYEINYSKNIVLLEANIIENELKFSFNILSGTSFSFKIIIENKEIYKELACLENSQTEQTEPTEPTKPEDPNDSQNDDSNTTTPDEENPETQEQFNYKLYVNGKEINSEYTIDIKETKSLIIEYEILDSYGNKQDFTSKIEIKDEQNITNNSLYQNYNTFSLYFFKAGQIEITLTSTKTNANLKITIIAIKN